MKTTHTILILAAALAAGTGAYAQNSNANGGRGPGARLTDEEREAIRAEHERIVSIYDEDGDGKLDAVEREVLFEDIEAGVITPPGLMRGGSRGHGPRGRHGPPPELVEQYDADGDGTLNADERAALHADIEAGVIDVPQRGPRGARRGPPAEIVEKFDADGDGVLNAEEREAVHAAIEAGEIDPPARRRGPRSGRGNSGE